MSLYGQAIYRRENKKQKEAKIPAEGDGTDLLKAPAQLSLERSASLTTMFTAVLQLIFCLFRIHVSS